MVQEPATGKTDQQSEVGNGIDCCQNTKSRQVKTNVYLGVCVSAGSESNQKFLH